MRDAQPRRKGVGYLCIATVTEVERRRTEFAILGYRAWFARTDRCSLWPLTSVGPAWSRTERIPATCLTYDHKAPHTGCHCGYTSYLTPPAVWPDTVPWRHGVGFEVRGAAAGWGRMHEHQFGWSAEFAVPLVLWNDRDWPDDLRAAARNLARALDLPTASTLDGVIALAEESAQVSPS